MAPEPYDLFLASLATCAGIYILGFCKRRELPVEDITMTQSWERDPEMRRMATIKITIETGPDFPKKYHKALERSVHQCSVKKTILDPPEFVVKAVAVVPPPVRVPAEVEKSTCVPSATSEPLVSRTVAVTRVLETPSASSFGAPTSTITVSGPRFRHRG